jgi:hypothetical protein
MTNNPALPISADGTLRRPIGLAVMLILLALANTFGGIFGLTHRAEIFSEFPRFTPALWNVYILCPLVGITAMAAMWYWRKWGFWLACVGAAIVFGIELYAMGLGLHLSRIVLAMGLIIFFMRPVWRQFR